MFMKKRWHFTTAWKDKRKARAAAQKSRDRGLAARVVTARKKTKEYYKRHGKTVRWEVKVSKK